MNDALGLNLDEFRRIRDKVPLWRGDHGAVKQLAEDFARYVYLTRLKHTDVLLTAIADDPSLFTCERKSFAYAGSYNEAGVRYGGLRADDGRPSVSITGLVVKPVAAGQFAREKAEVAAGGGSGKSLPRGGGPLDAQIPPPKNGKPRRRFYASTALDPMQMSRDASRIADEIVQHLAGLVGVDAEVRLELRAEANSGVPGHIVRTVAENCRTLKFDTARNSSSDRNIDWRLRI